MSKMRIKYFNLKCNGIFAKESVSNGIGGHWETSNNFINLIYSTESGTRDLLRVILIYFPFDR